MHFTVLPYASPPFCFGSTADARMSLYVRIASAVSFRCKHFVAVIDVLQKLAIP